jgi:hypothetical protein
MHARRRRTDVSDHGKFCAGSCPAVHKTVKDSNSRGLADCRRNSRNRSVRVLLCRMRRYIHSLMVNEVLMFGK